ncbi:MAG: tetratricopeptide repeat protein [Ignavibacteriae bacterium]|nr:tetratricopeptide repeat protein [Ignavibacteriota bacterium]
MLINKKVIFRNQGNILHTFTIIHNTDDKNSLDDAYKYLNNGNTGEATRLFEDYISKNPRATTVYLQLAYIYKQSDKDKASKYFQYVLDNSIDPGEIEKAKYEIDSYNKQKYTSNLNYSSNITVGSNNSDDLNEAYTALNSGNTRKAIEIFEAYTNNHPDDTKIFLQLAYIYDKEKNYDKALYNFDYVATNSSKYDEVDKARQSGIILRQMKAYNSFRSMSIYFYNAYDSYYQNYVSNFLGHINFKMSKYVYYGFYGDVYLDARTKKDYILNDRYLEGGGFMKFNFSNNIALELRLGYFRELDLDRNGVNFKPILSMGTRFGEAPIYLSRRNMNTEYFYFDIYSTELYDSKYKNLFAQIQLKEVLRYMTGGYSYLEFYLTQMAQADSRQLDYNNYGEISIGMDFKPNLVNFPAIFVEGTNRIDFIGPEGKYLQGDMRNIFQFKAGFIINFNLGL